MRLIMVFLLMNVFYTLKADIPVFVYDGTEINLEGKYIGIIQDTGKALNIKEIISRNDFKQSDQKVPNLMISDSRQWVKIKIKNQSDSEQLLLEYAYPIIDKVNLHQLNNDGNIKSEFSGEQIAINDRKYQHPNFIFEVNIPKGETKAMFLEIENAQQIMLPLKIGSQEKIFNSISREDIFSSIYIGIIIIMSLYNFVLFIAVKDNSYIYYVGYILAAGLTHISHHGYTYELLWPSSPRLAELSVALSPAIIGFATIGFIRSFLNIKTYAKKVNRLYDVFILVYLACIAMYFMGLKQISYQFSQSTALIISITIIATAVPIMRKGFRSAKFFVIAYTIFLLSVVVFILKDFGLLPYNTLTVYCLEIGTSAGLILLSFALADRINIMKQEKEEAQARELGLLQENQKMVEEQNIVLEQKVKERTQELEESNFDLNKALIDLKLAQSQLVDAEKMASLGQLTAGIAHEINNPINFVVANINPLKRDINDILEVLEKYAAIKEGDDISEKIREIEALKEDLDLDFTLEEIEQLLKGIDEGANRTVEIVKSLRTFSRLDEDGLKTADINECLDSTLMLLKNSLSDKLEIEKNYAENAQIECYPGKINQLFMNILNNAVHAVEDKMDANNTKGFIKLVTESHDNELIIKIKDNGIGMDEEVKKKIYDPFFTTKDIGKGTGLGLSIVHSIIEKHNAQIDVDSELGKGTEFTIRLPIKNNTVT